MVYLDHTQLERACARMRLPLMVSLEADKIVANTGPVQAYYVWSPDQATGQLFERRLIRDLELGIWDVPPVGEPWPDMGYN